MTAGTQLVESWWNLLKHHAAPEECPAHEDLIQQHVDAFVHKARCIGDPVSDLGAAVNACMANFLFEDRPWPHENADYSTHVKEDGKQQDD